MNTSRPFAESVLRFYRRAHARVLKLAEEVSPGQFAWSAGPSLHSIAWQVWHVARWDDFFAAHFMADFGREPHTEVWEREGVAAAWSLTAGALGQHDAGTGLNDAEAESVQLPDQDRVLDYARKAFAFAESAVEAMDGKLEEMAKDDRDGDTNLDNVYNYYEHLSRHLGMIEAIKGLQGLAGTATR